MDDYIEIHRDERHIKREREKARELRKSPFFQELLRKGVCDKFRYRRASPRRQVLPPFVREALRCGKHPAL